MRHASLTLAALVLAGLLPATTRAQQAPSAVVGEGPFEARLGTVPQRIVLGRVPKVVLHVDAAEGEGPLRPLRASVNVGRLGEVRRLAPGRYEIDYTPPRKKYPQVAIVAIWRETGPEAPVAFFRVPLLGTARVPVETVPRAKVTVNVAGERFGPFRANRRGHAVVRLVAPPGVPRATITATDARGKTTSAALDLDVPPYNRLTLAVVPHTIVADGRNEARLHLYYDAVGGRAPAASDLAITAKVGTVSEVRAERGPVYVASYTAPPGTPDQQVAFEASLRRDKVSGASAAITLGRQVPTRLEVELSPRRLVADGAREVGVRVLVLDALGLGVPGLSPRLGVSGGQAEAQPLVDRGKGLYVGAIVPGPLDPDAKEPQTLRVRLQAGGLASTASLVVLPHRPEALAVDPKEVRLLADGATATVLTVKITDAEGRPMTDVTPVVSAHLGRAASPQHAGDAWRIRYRPPTLRLEVASAGGAHPRGRDDLVTVRAGDLEAVTTVHLTPTLEVAPPERAYAEVVGGYASNLGLLAGPAAAVNLGLDVVGSAPFALTLGVAWSASYRRGRLTLPADASGAPRSAEVRLVSAPLLGEARLVWRGRALSLALGVGAGVLFMPGDVVLPGSGRLPVNDTLLALGGRLSFGLRAGPGSVVLEGTYVHAMRTSDGSGLDLDGQMGGPAFAVGYRLGL